MFLLLRIRQEISTFEILNGNFAYRKRKPGAEDDFQGFAQMGMMGGNSSLHVTGQNLVHQFLVLHRLLNCLFLKIQNREI